jgi:site-specific DNA-methyltransferase (adenine-specific)
MDHVWDADKGGRDEWIGWLTEILIECRRVLKPGAHALLWALPRTSHWTATALEDAGFEIRDVISHVYNTGLPKTLDVAKAINKLGDHPEEAARWQGWGTGLRPASEHWILARKPLDTTLARNVLKHGTGAINIDASRVKSRYPSNFICSVDQDQDYARHFYCPKPSKKERDAGCEDIPLQRAGWTSVFPERKTAYHNTHPTLKPLSLMRYLCRLITPPGGTVLDPFCGSGSTGVAALREGFHFIGIEQEQKYVEIARARLSAETETDAAPIEDDAMYHRLFPDAA